MARMGRPRWATHHQRWRAEVYMGHYMREWLAEQGMVKWGNARRRTPFMPMPIVCNVLRDRTVLYYRRIPGV